MVLPKTTTPKPDPLPLGAPRVPRTGASFRQGSVSVFVRPRRARERFTSRRSRAPFPFMPGRSHAPVSISLKFPGAAGGRASVDRQLRCALGGVKVVRGHPSANTMGDHRPPRPLSRQAAQRSKRCGGEVGRRSVVHRSDPTESARPTRAAERKARLEGCNIYRFDPRDGSLGIVADDFRRPNGLAFSPDEKLLYIADSGFWPNPDWPHHIRAFEVTDGKLGKSRVIAEVSPGISTASRSISTATSGRARATAFTASRRTAI